MYVPKRESDAILQTRIGDACFYTQDSLGYAIGVLVRAFAKVNENNLVDAIGVLESVKQEIYRKHLDPLAAQKEFDCE